jgi:hypothetical protein
MQGALIAQMPMHLFVMTMDALQSSHQILGVKSFEQIR